MNIESQIGLETLVIVKKGKVVGLARDPKTLVFFENKVNIDGLVDFSMTIQGGLSDKEKVDLIFNETENWNKGRVRLIVDL